MQGKAQTAAPARLGYDHAEGNQHMSDCELPPLDLTPPPFDLTPPRLELEPPPFDLTQKTQPDPDQEADHENHQR